MNEQELCKKRLMDLANQASQREIVTFSNFLNLNEQNIFHEIQRTLAVSARAFGGYELAERQMIAFIPDALCYEWNYPIHCICATPAYPKFAEKLSHRDVLGAVMSFGIDRGKIGDIICKEQEYYIFCDEMISDFLLENLGQIKHTMMKLSVMEDLSQMQVETEFEEREESIASNRIDCIIAKAYHLSRAEAARYLIEEKVFINGRCITNCNASCNTGEIVSVRGKGRFIFQNTDTINKKGKLRVKFLIYK